ncbi:MAG: glutathionylspermidine synthase family protein [Clostridia bacterium]|nr:glutathionylspermidine synthase family protein [Clostridia bacterium]
MSSQHVIDEYINEVVHRKSIYHSDYLEIKRKVENSTAKYKGRTIDFLYQPMFFDSTDIERLKTASEMLMNIIDKVIQEYLRNKQFREHFGFSDLMEQLILVDPGYSTNAPMARFDVFYKYHDDFKFCEFNGDGTSAMNETNTLERIFFQSDIIKNLQKRHRLYYHELFYSWIEEIIGLYREYGGSDNPNVAIVDWDGVATVEEFEEFKKRFEKKGFPTVIADPRVLEYKNGKLYYKDFRIDLVYRRALTWELVERSEQVKDFLDAYKDGAVCVVGPMRSQIMHNKKLFAILKDDKKTSFLNRQERDFINKYIPYTRVFDGSADQIAYMMENKDELVLKHQDRYAGKGVYLGRDYSEYEWKNIIYDAKYKGEYILQEFYQPGQGDFVVFDDEGNLEIQPYNYILGLYMYNRKFSGLYTRLSKNNIIANMEGYMVAPNIIIKS